MEINIDKNSPIPVGIQIKEQLKMLINSGFYKHGDKLPSIASYAASLGVNKNTVVAVLKDLETEGYIECFRGKGAFISLQIQNALISEEFQHRVDALIGEANRRKITLNELLNLINVRFAYVQANKRVKALFLMGVNRELIECNVRKLKENISRVDFEGFYIGKDTMREQVAEAFERVDFVVVPSIVYEYFKLLIPENKPIIKTGPELSMLKQLERGTEKKSKTAVIGASRNGAQIMAGMFITERFFRPKIVLAAREIEKYKKDLKDMDSFVICTSAKDAVDKVKFRDKAVYFFSDYVCRDSINDIKIYLEKINCTG
ncbi:MAG: GntR family transcriptional regulator [Clostridia bacterium]|nr:GntR family transcriptional regulator [Clostridia bacterium]